jgi:hypothetical protein
MFGPRITTVFRSRWRAVWFVASVLLGVYFSVPREHGGDDGGLAEVAAQLAPTPAPTRPANPWAKTAPR